MSHTIKYHANIYSMWKDINPHLGLESVIAFLGSKHVIN